MHFLKAGSGDTCLLLGDVYRLVEDDPCGGLVTRRHRGGAVVRHVMLRVRQKFAHPETFNFHGLPCAIHTIDNVNLVHVHVCIHVQCTRVTARLLPDAAVYTQLIRILLRIAKVIVHTARSYLHTPRNTCVPLKNDGNYRFIFSVKSWRQYPVRSF